MNIIFLDIDGVLTSARVHVAEDTRGMWSVFDRHAVQFLNRIAEEWAAEYVVSSTWRKLVNEQDLKFMLNNAGWRGTFHVNWATPVFNSGRRGEEIEAWMQTYYPDILPENYIILDDDADMLEHHMDRLVRTDPEDGMLFRHYQQIKRLTVEAE